MPWIPYKYFEWTVISLRENYLSLKEEQAKLVKQIAKVTDGIRELNEESENLTKVNEEYYQELRKNGGRSLNLDDEQYLHFESMEEGYVQRIDNLQKHIKDTSQKKVNER